MRHFATALQSNRAVDAGAASSARGRLCAGSGLDSWIATLPVHPLEAAQAHGEALRSRLAAYKMVRYDPEAGEGVRLAMDAEVFDRVRAAMDGAQPERVSFEPLDDEP